MGILSDMKKENFKHGFDFYVLLFFALSFLGWIWEVLLFLVTEHAFINRGVYRGPYLPIYGAGGLPKAHKSVCPFPVCLLCAGISDQLFSGAAMGNQMVGLQRTFPEYQWEDLSAGGSGFRTGRNGACVPVFAFL